MSTKKVDFDRLAAALRDYPFAYLVTVDDGYRVHTVTVEPELREQVLDVGLIGSKTLQEHRKPQRRHAVRGRRLSRAATRSSSTATAR